MLALTRKPGNKIAVGNDVVITVIMCGPGQVRLGIEAPPDVEILRDELHTPERMAEITANARKPRDPQTAE